MLSLFCDVAVPDVNPYGHPLGIDVGLNSFVATSDGELMIDPGFLWTLNTRREFCGKHSYTANSLLKLLNRDVARKQKGSKNQQKARYKVAKHYEKVANQRKAFHIGIANYLCDTAQTIYAEDLNLKGLAAGMLAKHCLDAGWGMFLNILKWVSFKRGVYFEKVDARGTSQLCPVCDVEVSKDLSVRIHECHASFAGSIATPQTRF